MGAKEWGATVGSAPLHGGIAGMESKQLVCMLYCSDGELGDRLERVLAGVAVQRVRSREALLAPPAIVCATVYGTTTCSDDEVEWLRSAFRPLSPPCVVVADLSVDCLRRLDPLRSCRLKVVWTAEAEDRLGEVLGEFGRVSWGPMWRLGLGLVSEPSLKPFVKETIRRACGLRNDPAGTPFVPEKSVGKLAREVGVATSTLRLCWREEVPLRCSLKEFLSWAVTLWGTRARALEEWTPLAKRLGLQRRSLERNFLRTAGCTLAEAAEDSERVVGRFNEWVDSVWEPHSGDGSGAYDRVPTQAPREEMP